MKKGNIFLSVIIILIFIGFAIAVANIFNFQLPSDLSTTNVLGTSLNISYNISDASSLNLSTILLYYKVNSSTLDTNFFFTNGTLTSGFQTKAYSSNSSNSFLFRLFHDNVYPAIYNYNENYMQAATHSALDLDDFDTYVKIRFFNVSNNKNYSFFEVYAENQTATSLSLMIYYCNSSYTGNVNPLTSNLCTNFYNLLASQPFNHSHQVSKHHVIPFPINTTSKMIGSVYVTNTSYFLLRGRNGVNAWNVYYIPNISIEDTIQEDINGGAGVEWENVTGTVDAHLHQYDGTEKLWYYACANGSTSPTQNCTSLRSDLIDLSGLPPSAPNVYSPTNRGYRGNITINYSAAASPNAYPIFIYNLTLRNSSDDFVSVITANNSVNLSYVWDSTGTPDGSYNIHVHAYDSNNLLSTGESDDFTIDYTNPTISSFSCSPSEANLFETIACSCIGADATSEIASTIFTAYPPTGVIGTFSISCNVSDSAGNSIVNSISYSVKNPGSFSPPAGGGTSGGTPSTPTISSEQQPATPEVSSALENESINVIVKNKTHTLDILEIGENSVKTIFSYDGSEQNFFVGEEKTFEIDDYIVRIKLEKIEGKSAVFNVLTEIKQVSDLNFIIIISLVIITVVISAILLKKRKKKRTDMHQKKFFASKKQSDDVVKKEIAMKIQTAKRLRERAKELIKEAKQKKILRAEAMNKLKKSYTYRKKSKELVREAKKICKNCKIPYRKFK